VVHTVVASSIPAVQFFSAPINILLVCLAV
jgi:hypothetical protein